jgi:GTP diphosphokinase / guanosine-3',5'-bis(diphosphate) 3'-diphosphatase
VTKSSDALTRILKAAQFAAGKHKDLRHKDAASSPYINHPLALANVLREEGKVNDVRVIVAALLHDTIEDTETGYDELRGQLGMKLRRSSPKSEIRNG